MNTADTTRKHNAVDHREATTHDEPVDSEVRDARHQTPEERHEDARRDQRSDSAARHDLLGHDDREDLRERWDHLQASFVDDPRDATERAHELLRTTFDEISQRWQDHHRDLRAGDDEDQSTEELRTALRRYRDAFERLLSF